MPSILSFDIIDYSRETSGFSLQVGAVTAISLPGLLTEVGTLRAATAAIILGNMHSEELVAFRTVLENDPPVSDQAQVERGWFVSYEDSQQFFDPPVNAIPNSGYLKKFGFTIATADTAGRLITNTDEADLTDPEISAWITAFEAVARSPYGGTVNVLKITHVGRNR